MQRLLIEESTEKHQKALEYHLRLCHRRKVEDIFLQLMKEGTPLRDKLENKVAEIAAKLRVIDELSADFDSQELVSEDVIRDVDGDLQRIDRQEPTLNAQKKVFPEGFSVVIVVEGEGQIETLLATRQSLRSFETRPQLQDSIHRLDAVIVEMSNTVKEREKERSALQTLVQDEKDVKTEIAEHLVAAHGRLRAYFKAKPAQADRFFLRAQRGALSPVVKAEARGKSSALLAFLSARELEVSEPQKKKLQETYDLGILDRWISRAASASVTEDLFATDPEPSSSVKASASKTKKS